MASDVTKLLKEFGSSGRDVNDRVYEAVYDELRKLARMQLSRERDGHTLSPTALVHEAYLKMVDQTSVEWKSGRQFFLVAAEAMRRILVNHARARNAQKRAGAKHHVSLDEVKLPLVSSSEELLAIDEALERLNCIDERKCRVVKLRYFCGFSADETAEILDVSPATLFRDWAAAKAWLYRELSPAAA